MPTVEDLPIRDKIYDPDTWYRSLTSHEKNRSDDEYDGLEMIAEYICELVDKYVRDVDIPTVDDVITFLCKLSITASPIRDPVDMESVGVGLFPSGAIINHSCNPNVELYLDSVGQARYIATKLIKEGCEVTVSYCDIYQSRVSRQAHLFESYYFTCTCERCTYEISAGDNTHVDSIIEQYICIEGSCRGFINVADSDAKDMTSVVICPTCGIGHPKSLYIDVKRSVLEVHEKLGGGAPDDLRYAVELLEMAINGGKSLHSLHWLNHLTATAVVKLAVAAADWITGCEACESALKIYDGFIRSLNTPSEEVNTVYGQQIAIMVRLVNMYENVIVSKQLNSVYRGKGEEKGATEGRSSLERVDPSLEKLNRALDQYMLMRNTLLGKVVQGLSLTIGSDHPLVLSLARRRRFVDWMDLLSASKSVEDDLWQAFEGLVD